MAITLFEKHVIHNHRKLFVPTLFTVFILAIMLISAPVSAEAASSNVVFGTTYSVTPRNATKQQMAPTDSWLICPPQAM